MLPHKLEIDCPRPIRLVLHSTLSLQPCLPFRIVMQTQKSDSCIFPPPINPFAFWKGKSKFLNCKFLECWANLHLPIYPCTLLFGELALDSHMLLLGFPQPGIRSPAFLAYQNYSHIEGSTQILLLSAALPDLVNNLCLLLRLFESFRAPAIFWRGWRRWRERCGRDGDVL